MAALAHQRCFNHAAREAAARCPECRQFFCRECITEHEGRVICAGCLRRITAPPAARAGRWRARLASAVAVTIGVVMVWLFFQVVGETLLSIPASFHEGTLWQDTILGEKKP